MEANLISSLNSDILTHVINFIDDVKAIVALSLTSKKFGDSILALIQPKLRHALPFSYEKYTTLSQKVNVYHSLISAQDVTQSLQFYEFDTPRANAQVRLEAYQVITKMLPWNSNMFVEISVAQSIVQKGPAYLCVYSMERAAPLFTTELLNGRNPSESVLVFEALAFNAKLKCFALAYHYGCIGKFLQVVRVYSFKADDTVELILDEEYEKAASINFPDISMAVTDTGYLWISFFKDGPACISIAEKTVAKLDLDPEMREIAFAEYKGEAILISQIEDDNGIWLRIDDAAEKTTLQSHRVTDILKGNLARVFYDGVKADQFILDARYSVFGEPLTTRKLDYVAIDLEKKTCTNIGGKFVSSSGKYLLDQDLDQLSTMKFTNGVTSDELIAKYSDNMAKSGCKFQWSANKDIVVASVPYKRCLVVENFTDRSMTALMVQGKVEEAYPLANGDALVKYQYSSGAEKAIKQFNSTAQQAVKPPPAPFSGFGSFFGFESVKLGVNFTEHKRPAIGVYNVESKKEVVPSIELPFQSELMITHSAVTDDQKHLLIATTCGLSTVVLKMRL